MNKYRYLLTAAAALCLFSNAALAQEEAPGDACTAAEEDFTIQVGGPENTGVLRFLHCNGTNWRNYITLNDDQVAIGIGAADEITTSTSFIAIGKDALGKLTTNSESIAVGRNALSKFTEPALGNGLARSNVAFGNNALQNVTTGDRNVGFGNGAGASISTGSNNTFLGDAILAFGINGADNTLVGFRSMYNPGSGGSRNSALGKSTLINITGDDNVAIGNNAGIGTGGTVNRSIFVGSEAGFAAAGSNNNIFIGYQAGYTTTAGSNNIVIGHDIDSSSATASNELNIGATVFGNLTTDQVGIGTTSVATIDASAALEVLSTSRGFLPPRVANTAAVTTPAKGLVIFDNSADRLKYNTGTSGSPVWTTIGGATPAGADTQVQFNNSGALGASANFTWASNTLTVTGDILFTGITRDLSDARRKENITRITGALDKIGALDGVSFIMKDDPNRAVELGLIAQDVEKVFPELVITTADGTMALNYQGMVGPLVEAVKELDAKNTELDSENTELRAALDALSSRIDALEGKPYSRSRSNSYRFNQ